MLALWPRSVSVYLVVTEACNTTIRFKITRPLVRRSGHELRRDLWVLSSQGIHPVPCAPQKRDLQPLFVPGT